MQNSYTNRLLSFKKSLENLKSAKTADKDNYKGWYEGGQYGNDSNFGRSIHRRLCCNSSSQETRRWMSVR